MNSERVPSTSTYRLCADLRSTDISSDYVRDRSHDYWMEIEEENEDEVVIVEAQMSSPIPVRHKKSSEKRLEQFPFLREEDGVLYCIYCRTYGSDKNVYAIGKESNHRNNRTDRLKEHQNSAYHLRFELKYSKRMMDSESWLAAT